MKHGKLIRAWRRSPLSSKAKRPSSKQQMALRYKCASASCVTISGFSKVAHTNDAVPQDSNMNSPYVEIVGHVTDESSIRMLSVLNIGDTMGKVSPDNICL